MSLRSQFYRLVFATLSVFGLISGSPQAQAQTWTVLSHQPSVGLRICLLMTDASVICQSGHDWYKLTPDLAGSYVNGTWSQIASFPSGYEPYVYASAVLADGRVVVVGGEYDASGNIVLSNQGAVYDPVANTWTPLAPPSGWSYIGDAPATVLANGQFLIGSKLDTRIALLDPATLTWTVINPTGKADFFNSEENWMLLPDGSVFTLDVKNAFGSERFIPSTSTWVTAGLTPVDMHSPPGEGPVTIAPGVVYTPPGDMGPAVLLPDGRVFAEGGNGHTAVYTPPPANSSAPGTWVQAPDFPGGLYVDDGPAAALPNGHVLAVASPPGDRLGLSFFEFDGANLIPVPASPNASADASNFTSLLLLPTGQVLLVDTSTSVQVYTAAGTYSPSWAPTVSAVPATLANGSSYQISGTQFNGLSQGSAFGDENQNATNYPLVRITNNASGHVFYARTHGHSSMGVATGSTPVSTNFDVPVNTELGASTLTVVANGIPSAPVAVSINSTNPPPITVGCPPSTGILGSSYSSAFIASGGQPPFTFSIVTGSLPSNLLLTVGTGAVAGMPNTVGVSNFTVKVTDSASGSVTANCTMNVTPPPTVSFQGNDAATQGNWKGVYGSDGYLIANDSSSAPVYGTVGVTGASTWTWVQSTTDSRGLLKGASTTDRIASTFYSGSSFTFDVNLTGGQHQAALYLLDFDTSSRSETVSIIDANTNAVLDTQAFANFHGGIYAIWTLQGHVLIKVAHTGGQNAVVSGLFFGTSGGGTSTAAPVISISAPSAGSVSGTVTVTANATAAGGMASVQFQLDGTNLGTPVTGSGPAFSTSWNTTASSNASHTLTAIATDQLGQHATSPGVIVSVANGGSSGSSSTSFLTGYALSGQTLRNDFSGWVGMKLTVGANPLSIATLGRICVANNAQAHVVKLVNASNGGDVTGASALVNMAGCTAGQFVYAPLEPITLPAGASYYLVSQETQGGDRWYDEGAISASNVATVTSSVYFNNGSWYPIGGGNTSYAPPNFQYTTATVTQYPLTTSVSPVASGAITANPAAAAGTYNSGTQVQLTATPASGCAFVNWTGALTGATNPQTVTMSAAQAVTANFQCSGSTSTSFLTGYATGGASLRNDFSGWVGMKLTVGANPLSIASLGRICVANNAASHTVKLVNAGNGSDVPGASVSVNMAGCTAGQFVYGALIPITLPAGASYYLVSQETQGGDRWYDQGPISPTNVATVNSSVYSYNGGWYPIGGGNTSYVPPNFQYTTSTGIVTQYPLTTGVSPAASGSIAMNPSSPGGSYNSGTAVQLTATPASGCTFVNWTGALTGSTNPQTVTMSGPQTVTANFQCSGTTSTNFLTSFALNNPSLRNDFSGFVGMKLTVGANPLTVTALGRICVANNASTHTVKLANANNGTDVAGASVSVNMAGCTPGQFVYGAVSSITLPAGTSYYLASQETQGGDRWYDQGPISATNVAAVNNSVYFYNGTWISINSANTSYVPPNFQYTVASH
jgi:List-Bact-rpt repeat protein/Big-like domain-containing protein/putative Ig domain-containing protein/Kelch motif protein